VLELLDAIEPGDQYLLPTRSRRRKGHLSGNSLTQAMDYFGRRLTRDAVSVRTWLAEPPTPHDLRRTVGTRLAELRIPKEIRDRVLNHAPADVGSRHYNLHDYVDEKRNALHRWAAVVEAIVAGSTRAAVVQLAHARAGEALTMARNGDIPRDESWINDPVTGEEIGSHETYGIHSLEILPMEENRVPGPPLPIREFNLLAATARDALQAAGEQTDQEIAEPFVLAQTLGGVRDDRPIHDALINWYEGIILRHGKLSRLSFAARFLATGRNMVSANRPPSDPAGFRAVCDFAQAWGDWHMEISGVHATAFYGKRRDEDFEKARAVRSAIEDARRTVISDIVGDLLGDETRNCGQIAEYYIGSVNVALKKHSLPETTQGALKKRLERARKHRNGKAT
jgi:hypothetical protein